MLLLPSSGDSGAPEAVRQPPLGLAMPALYQTFDDVNDPVLGRQRLVRLRKQLAIQGLDGFIVPRADEHQNEYVPPSAERLAWLTGFTGSAGLAIVLADRAAVLTDGRYTLQVRDQVDLSVYTPVSSMETSAEDWIARNLPAGAALGYDPWLHTVDGHKRLAAAVSRAGGRLVAVERNPVDLIWTERPQPPVAVVRVHPPELAGESAATKIERVRAALADAGCDALLVSDPHNLAWLFNIRGGDVAHTPLPLGYALVPRDGQPTLFLDSRKVPPHLIASFHNTAYLTKPAAMLPELRTQARAGMKLRLDAATAPCAIAQAIEAAGGQHDVGPDPITRMKAVKNAAEIAGSRAAHLRDGVAMVRFLSWLDSALASGQAVTEIDTVEALEAFRRDTGLLKDVSFPTISGSGPNGAIVHYRVTQATNRALQPGELFLIDSGGQYEDGTTDITRTVAIGTPTPEMRDRFTRVLKGHIAIALAEFPKGSSGAQIDTLARLPLWAIGADFDHGTGHGVGSYLSVHEGPQRISKLGTAALEPGMILSNEPGYYRSGAYGIRIENLVLVEKRERAGLEREMLGFDTLTLCPIDRRLIDPTLMSERERHWLDAYHARVREALSPHLTGAASEWLDTATQPLRTV